MYALRLPELDTFLCYHDLAGLEPTFVFLHGLGSASSADFPAVVRHPRLAPCRALLVDLLGFGFSGRPAQFSYTLEAHAETVARLLDHLELRDCYVVGHSLGGSIAIVLAGARPDLVASLIVAEPNFEPQDATGSATIAAQSEGDYVATGHSAYISHMQAWAHDDPAVVPYVGTLSATAPHAAYRSSTSLVAASLTETYCALNMPKTYVVGELTLPHWHEALLREREARVIVVPGASHGSIFDNVGYIGDALADTLSLPRP